MQYIHKYVYRFNSIKFLLWGAIPGRGTRVAVTNEDGTPKNLVWRSS